MYNKSCCILCIIMILCFISCNDDNELIINKKIENDKKITLWVNSIEGLNIRQEPDIQSEIIDVVPFSSEVIYLDKSFKDIKVNNIIDKWYKIEWNKHIGWVFGGYLSDSKDSMQNVVDERNMKKLEVELANPFEFEIYDNIDSIIDTFGKPIKVEEKDIVNKYDESVIDKVTSIYYDGLIIEIYFASSTGMELLWKIKLTNQKHKLNSGLRVGSNVKLIEERYGKYSETGNNIIYYMSPMNTLAFKIKKEDNVIDEIIWSTYLE